MTTNRILAGLLAVQLALAAVTWWPGESGDAPPVAALAAPLAEWTVVEIVGQTTGDAPPKPVRVVKEGDRWVLASAGGFPADAAKVQQVIDNLAKIELGNPISTKATSHRDLGVADDTFTRKVTIGSGGKTTTLYLGAGTGSGLHVRREGTDSVYAVRGFTAWSVGDADARYLDSSYVKVDPKSLRTLKIANPSGTWTLVQAPDDTWSIAEAPGVAVDPGKSGSLARRAVDVRMTKPVGTEIRPDHALTGETRVEWTAEGPDGAPIAGGYTIGAARETFHYVKADDREWVVEVAGTTLQPLLDFTPAAVAGGT
ncbi:MAG: DUF4340 domain-containing protein [Deltaproteobacteria bacterium]|nr:DUF4340 domain-containing protein [Deltaproteobacteria bacterium]